MEKEGEGDLHLRYVESELPGDIQAEMLVSQLEMDAWKPKREVRPEEGT